MKKLLSIILVALILVGCGSSSDYNQSTDSMAGIENGYYGSDLGYTSGSGVNESVNSSSDNKNADFEQKIITNGNLNVETKEFDKTIEAINKAVADNGGYTQSSNIRKTTNYSGDGELRYATLTVRIPAEKLENFLTVAEQSGNVVSSNFDSDDITTQYYDIQADIEALEAQEDRLLELYKKAETIEDLIQLENRLSNLRNDINKKKMTIKNYDLLTKYSTVTLDIEEVEVLTETSKNFFSLVGTAFAESFINFRDFLMDAFIDLIYVFPFLVFYCGIGLGLAWLLKRNQAKVKERKAKKVAKELPKENFDNTKENRHE